MELAFEKLIADNKLNVSDLPEDARDGISEMGNIKKIISLREKQNKPPTDATLRKIKRLDKWICMEIDDHIAGKTSNNPAPDITAADIKADITKQDTGAAAAAGTAAAASTGAAKEEPAPEKEEKVQADPKGVAIDEEVKALIEAGIKQLTLPELKEKAPKAYSVIFDSYKEGEENGYESSYYRILETEKEKFTLSKI